jgi:glycosyltransferase involved in cell wall biosynthesis
VTVAGKIEYHKLVELYNRHEFYLQLSVAEGFPNTLCEAMLCGCIPIGSNVFSIPKIIGDTGFVLKHRNMDELKRLQKPLWHRIKRCCRRRQEGKLRRIIR